MHCIGELMLAMPTWSGFRCGASTPWRAAFTAAIMRSDPIAMMRSTVSSGTSRGAELAVLIGEHRLHDVAAEVRVLRPPGRDRRADVGAPDHLIGRRLDVLALEQILALLVAGEIDHLVAVLAHRLRDREQHGVAEAAAEQQHVLAVGNLGRRAGRTHDDDRLALLQVRDQPARHAELERDERQQPALLVDPRAGQRDALPSAAASSPDAPRHRLVVLQPVELARVEVPRRRRRLDDDLDDGRRQAHDVLDDARDELGVEPRHQPRPRRVALRLRAPGSSDASSRANSRVTTCGKPSFADAIALTTLPA